MDVSLYYGNVASRNELIHKTKFWKYRRYGQFFMNSVQMQHLKFLHKQKRRLDRVLHGIIVKPPATPGVPAYFTDLLLLASQFFINFFQYFI